MYTAFSYHHSRATVLLALMLCAVCSSPAATYTWTGDGNNAWGDTNNWDIAGTPGGTDDVIYYDNPFSGDAYAGLNNFATGGGARYVNSITFDSAIGSAFRINPRGDAGAGNDSPSHYLVVYGGGIDVQTTSTITLNVDVELGNGQLWNVLLGGHLIADEQVRGSNNLERTGHGTLTLTGNNTFSGRSGFDASGGDSTTSTINLQHNNALGTSQFWYERGGILELGVGGLTVSNGIYMANWSVGARTIKLDLTGTQTGELSGVMWHQHQTFGAVVFDVGSDDTLTYSGAIEAGTASGAGLVKNGSGTLVLSSSGNTYKGTTRVSDGILRATGGTGSLPGATHAIQANSPGTLQLVGNNLTWGNAITGDGTVNVEFGTGGGNTQLTNVTGFTGTVELTKTGASTADKWNANGVSAGNIDLIVNDGTQLYVNTGASTLGSISVTGTGNTENRGAIRMWSGGSLAGSISLAGDTTIGLHTSTTVSGDISSGAAGTQTLTLGTANQNDGTTFSGVIGGGTGTINVVKDGGSGTATLSGVNTYSGTTTVNAGVLQMGNNSALGSGGLVTTVNNGGALDLNGADNVNEDISIVGVGDGTNGALYNSPGDTASIRDSRTLTLTGDAAIGGGQRIDIRAGITDNANDYTLTMLGTGINLWTSNLDVANLDIQTSSVIIKDLPRDTLTVRSGATAVAWRLTDWGTGDIVLENNATIQTSRDVFTTAANIAVTGTVNIKGNNDSGAVTPDQATYSGDITGTGGLTIWDFTQNQNYKFFLSGSNSYSGGTTVGNSSRAVALLAGSTTGLSSNSAFNVTTNATLKLNGNNNTIASLTGTGTVENDNASAATLTTGDASDTTFSGALQDGAGGGALSIVKQGAGTFTLSSTNHTYSGTTTINAGTLLLSRGNNPGTVPLGTMTINNGATLSFATFNQLSRDGSIPDVVVNSGGIIDSSATVTTFDALTLDGGTLESNGGFNSDWGSFVILDTLTVTSDSLIEDASGSNNSISPGQFNGSRTLTVDVANGVTLTNELPITDYTPSGNTYTITKNGAGTLALSATSTYSGTTTVAAGTLEVTGATGSGDVNVSSNATLSGTGTIGGTVTISAGGILSPGL